jgi:hypothetical protein
MLDKNVIIVQRLNQSEQFLQYKWIAKKTPPYAAYPYFTQRRLPAPVDIQLET